MKADVLYVNALGKLEIFWNNRKVTKKLSKKSSSLLIYLALNRGQEFDREVLAHKFWSNSDSKSARYNLRHALWHIKKVFAGTSPINSSQAICRFSQKVSIESDCERLEACHQNKELLETEAIEEVQALYRGHFASNTTLNHASEVNDWILYMNSYTERLFFEITEYLARRYREAESFSRAIALYEKLLLINPYHEALYLGIMESYIDGNHPAKAIEVYERCQRILRNELNSDPQQELKTLYFNLTRNRMPVSKESAAPKSPETAAPEVEKRTVFIESDVEYYGLLKLIEAMLTSLGEASNLPEEISLLSSVYPPAGRGTTCHRCVTEAGILYAFKALVVCYQEHQGPGIVVEGISETDRKSHLILHTLLKEFDQTKNVLTVVP